MKIKVSLGIIVFLVLYTVTTCVYEKVTTMKPILKSEEVHENLLYVQECLLGKLFKLNSNEILYTYIKDSEIYIDLINLKDKKTTNRTKIGKEALSDIKISAPHIISNPEFIETKDGNILISLNGVKDKKIVTKVFLYNIKENNYIEIPTKLSDIKAPLLLDDNKFIIYSKNKGVFSLEVFDKNKLVSTFSKANKRYVKLSLLQNGKILILDTWQNPVDIYDVEKNQIRHTGSTIYKNQGNYEELEDGSLVFVTNEDKKYALEYYNPDTEDFHVILSDAKGITLVPLIGNKILGERLFAKINNDYYTVYPAKREYKKITDIEGETLSFPVAISKDKVLLNKADGVKILDLEKGEVVNKNPIKYWPGSFIYKLTDNKSIIINDGSNMTHIFNNDKNTIKKGMRLSSDYYHSYPHQVLPLDDGRYIVHYMETYSLWEKKYGFWGKLAGAILVSICEEDTGGICDVFNNQPYYSFIMTEVGK